jgi:hypothetical protein
MRDSYVRWLRFSCDEVTMSKIRALDGAKPLSFNLVHGTPGRSDQNPNAPAWWTGAAVSSSMETLEFDRSRPSESEIVSIWIDKKTHTVYAARNVFH